MENRTFFNVEGNNYLHGIIKPGGSKNASLGIVFASLALKNKITLYNIPRINDIFASIALLEYLNVKTSFKENTLILDATNIIIKPLIKEEVTKLRASSYLLGALADNYIEIAISSFGGCQFAQRKINFHQDLILLSNGTLIEENNYYMMKYQNIIAFDYCFPTKSLGASINACLIGLKNEEYSTLENYSQEIEFDDFTNFLIEAGVSIKKENNRLLIKKGEIKKEVSYTIMPDRIELETFALLGLINGNILLCDFVKNHHRSFLLLLNQMKVKYHLEDEYFHIEKQDFILPDNVKFGDFPLLSTDLASIFVSCALHGHSLMIIEDLIYPQRLLTLEAFKQCFYFQKNKCLFNPHKKYPPKFILRGTNLRDTMAYLIYALTHKGQYRVYGDAYLFRGYEDIIAKINSLGGKITLEKE